MDAAKIRVAVNSLLECSICYEVYKDPRILPCGHTFCLGCIQKIKKCVCPVCKSDWKTPANGVQGLPKNFVADSFITSLPSVTECSLAEDEKHSPVKYLCIDCWDPLCDTCGERHTKYCKSTKNHEVKRLDEINSKDFERHNRQVIQLCKEHGNQEIILYCKKCKKSGCNTCHLLFHVGHPCTTVEEADKESIENIKKSLRKTEEIIQGWEKKSDEIAKLEKHLKDNNDQIKAEVTKFTDDAKAQIQIACAKLITDIDKSKTVMLEIVGATMDKRATCLQDTKKSISVNVEEGQKKVELYKKHLPPLSSAIERERIIYNDEILVAPSQNDNITISPCQDISKWKKGFTDTLQSVNKAIVDQNYFQALINNTQSLLEGIVTLTYNELRNNNYDELYHVK